MTSKKDKQQLLDCDARIKEMRLNLGEQIKCLDQQTDLRSSLLNDVQDFFKRKSEIESDYAKKLDGLSEKYILKHKQIFSMRKEHPDLPLQSPLLCWMLLLEQCQRESKDHSMVSNIYVSQMLPRIQYLNEDIARIHKKNREISLQIHEDFLEDLKKLYGAMQLYQVHWAEFMQTEMKYKQVEKQFEKRNEKNVDFPKTDGKVRRSTSFRKLEKLREKRLDRFSEANLKCIKARNEYILQLEATNATLNKYYNSDVEKLLDTSTLGYHTALQRTWDTYCEAESAAQNSRLDGITRLKGAIDQLDSENDKRKFLKDFDPIFNGLSPFVFTGHSEDNVKKVSLTQPQLYRDMEKRCSEMERTMQQMTVDQEELKKSLEASLTSMNQLASSNRIEVASAFDHNFRNSELLGSTMLIPPASPPPHFKEVGKVRNNVIDTEAYYLQKYKEFLQKSNQLNRLEARHAVLEKSLKEEVPIAETNTITRSGHQYITPKPRKKSFVHRKRSKKHSSSAVNHYHRNLLKYLEEYGRSIPLIVESCIRMINLYGLHHQGIFRVPGSHQDILEMKSRFEKGDDPVSEKQDKSDINTVAGLLKLYFRELDERLFPPYVFDDLVQCAHISNLEDRTDRIRKILLNIPESVLVVMRYLFAFLNHLSQNSDENMMDAYNIAVCFGPTLLPVPDTYDLVTTQANVNEIIKTIVLNHEQIFPVDMDGPVYEVVMASEEFVEDPSTPATAEDGELHVDQVDGGMQSSSSDDESDQSYEAVAKYDYKGRSDRELSFFKGDTLDLYRQANEDWWEGGYKGRDGLIPNAYIIVQDYISDGASDLISSHTESEISLDSTSGPPQSPSHRRLSADASRQSDISKLPVKTKSLGRYNNAQEYIRQQRAMAGIASKAAQQGLARTSDSSAKTSNIAVMRSDDSALIEREEDSLFTDSGRAPSLLQERIANLRRTSKGSGIDPNTLQDIDETMKNALSELQALDMQGHKATPDVVLDTLDNRSKRSLSDSPTVNVGPRGKSDSPSPQTSGNWRDHLRSASSTSDSGMRLGGAAKNANNNSTSHYQVPTRRYLDAPSKTDPAAATTQVRSDFLGSQLKNSSGKYQPGVKQSLRKTAL